MYSSDTSKLLLCSLMKQPLLMKEGSTLTTRHMDRQIPHKTRQGSSQHHSVLNMWTEIVANYLVDPYILPPPINAHTYIIFLEEALPEFLNSYSCSSSKPNVV
ncbi:hypothetical protein TNCV_814991 [Trichonephila clavipes]|nr:hypothetical protein TNCV_814991 [Trichonephila clavipes]